MTHRPLYAKKHHHWFSFILLLALCAFAWYFYPNFSPEKVIEQSELKNHTFSAKVQEITAPKSEIKAYFMPENTNPIISIHFSFEGAGSISDNAALRGLSNITAQMLLEGCGNLNSQNFKEELENYAIEIGYHADSDDFNGSLLTTKDNLSHAVKLLHDTLTSPLLDAKDFERIKQQTATYIDRLSEQPSEQLNRKSSEILFAGHPYSYSPLGTKEDIKKITVGDIRAFISKNLAKDNLYIGIAGDLSAKEASEIIDNIFGELPDKNELKTPQPPKIDFSIGTKDLNENLPQVLTRITAPGVERLSKEFYPLYIANHIFGGSGLSSRINQATREKEGLTYGAYTALSLQKQAPLLTGGFSTTPQNFSRMQEIFRNEWNKMGEEGISSHELNSAKNYLISSYNLRFSDISTIAEILSYMQKEKLGKDFLKKRNSYVEKVTLEQVNIAAKKYFAPQSTVIINYGLTEDSHEQKHK